MVYALKRGRVPRFFWELFMSIDTEEELLGMLDVEDFGEWFQLVSGKRFQAVWNAPTADELGVRGYSPTLTVLDSLRPELPKGCELYRSADNSRWKVKAHEPVGDGSFALIAVTAVS